MGKGYHTVFVFLCLTCFTWQSAFQVHSRCCKWQNLTLFNDWAVFHRMCAPRLHPSVRGHFLPYLDNRKWCCWAVFWVSVSFFPSRYVPRSGISGSHGSSVFTFGDTAELFSTLAAPVCTPAGSAQRFPSPASSTMLVICGLSEDSHPEDVRWDLTVVWVCISLVSDAEHLSMCLLAICRSPLEKCLFRSSVHCKIRVFFFDVELYDLFVYLGC